MLIFVVALLGALIPTTFYVLFVWWLDRYEKEPFWLLALAFLWGAGPAAILSVFFELLVDAPLHYFGEGDLTGFLLSVSISAPVIEESFKGIALIGLVLVFHNEFDDVLDGIVYGAMIGFGFAFTENLVGYFLPILSGQGISAGLVNIFLRAVVFGTNQGFWTAITGAAIGYARLSHTWGRRLLVPVGGWALAVLLHSLHNAGASMVGQTLGISLGFTLMLNWGGVLLLLLVALSAQRREGQWIERGLAEEVNSGALTREEFDLLRSPGRRLQARWQARKRGGRTAYRAVGRYYQCATELAFKKQQLRQPDEEKRNAAAIQQLRRQLASYQAGARPWLWPEEG